MYDLPVTPHLATGGHAVRKTALLMTAALALALCAGAHAQQKTSSPWEYSGYSQKEYSSYKSFSAFVEMSDGVKLAVDVYLPRKGPKRDKFPAVVEYTPYSRAYINPAFALLDGTGRTNLMGGEGAVIPNPFCLSKTLLENGYAVVIADIRGSGASFGSRLDLMPRIGDDGDELLAWIAQQPWSDGAVGMKGASYMAMSQILTAARKPSALKAIFLMVYPFGYQDLYPGGVYSQGFMNEYSKLLKQMNSNLLKTDGAMFPIMPTAPAADEDGDGKLLDEIPLDKNGNGSFTDDYAYPEDPNDPPQYEDGQPRQHLYFLATKQHAGNQDLNAWMSAAQFMDTTGADLGFDDQWSGIDGYALSPIANVPAIMESGIPIYHLGGWFDAQPRSTTLFFATAKNTNPSKLLMLPGYHIIMSPFYEYFGDSQQKYMDMIGREQLRFFDRYLKGIPNGLDTEPPVTLYVMNSGLRQEQEWPPSRQVSTDYYFADGGALAASAPAPGSMQYKADLSHDSRFGPNKGNRWLMFIIPPEAPDRAELDKKCLTYTTAPLERDTEVTGHPIVEFWAQSTAPDGDFFAYLEDVAPDGRAILISEMPQRAGFAALHDNDTMILRGAARVNVKPELPWHGYEKAHYDPQIFASGAPVKLAFDLHPTSWVFKKGHRIRVSLAAADWPTFNLHPALSPANDPASPGNTVPTITILHGADHPSRITLPVIPADSQ
jgi:putative CocE/NonD family hydrolase